MNSLSSQVMVRSWAVISRFSRRTDFYEGIALKAFCSSQSDMNYRGMIGIEIRVTEGFKPVKDLDYEPHQQILMLLLSEQYRSSFLKMKASSLKHRG
jgi:hypothetical protein